MPHILFFIRFFSHMKQLEYINISSNSLSTFPPILGSPRLRCLLLHSNQLTALPAMLPLPQLHTLDLACNQFESVPDLSSFPRLQFLNLSGNVKLSVSRNSIKMLIVWSTYSAVILGTLIEINFPFHGRWNYGSAQVVGNLGNLSVHVDNDTHSIGWSGSYPSL